MLGSAFQVQVVTSLSAVCGPRSSAPRSPISHLRSPTNVFRISDFVLRISGPARGCNFAGDVKESGFGPCEIRADCRPWSPPETEAHSHPLLVWTATRSLGVGCASAIVLPVNLDTGQSRRHRGRPLRLGAALERNQDHELTQQSRHSKNENAVGKPAKTPPAEDVSRGP